LIKLLGNRFSPLHACPENEKPSHHDGAPIWCIFQIGALLIAALSRKLAYPIVFNTFSTHGTTHAKAPVTVTKTDNVEGVRRAVPDW
jgi:hypothetical protein